MNYDEPEQIDEKIRLLKVRKNEVKKKLHKQYINENGVWIRTLDLLFILCILFNIGALCITNALVVKESENVTFTETNPVTSDMHGFKATEDKSIFTMFLIQGIAWTILTFCYLYNRSQVYNKLTFWLLVSTIVLLVTLLGMDFFNDFGYLLGVMWHG